MSKFEQFCKNLENKIIATYEEGVSLTEAEKLAGEFLHAQIVVSNELKKADLNSRMRKTGLKALRSALYLDAATKSDKKPSDTYLDNVITSNELVSGEQNALDTAEVERDDLERYYNIFQNAHIHYRGIAKGSFGG